ncbi:hypothetical protein LCGC14_3153760, partial [marine sediment metagenome]
MAMAVDILDIVHVTIDHPHVGTGRRLFVAFNPNGHS